MLFFFADKSSCETLGNNYKYILGNCYYIEATAFDFTEASENCKDRFGGYGIGRLFEPTNQKCMKILGVRALEKKFKGGL